MNLTVIGIVLCILILTVLPLCIGNTVCCILNQNLNVSNCFVYGHVIMWALCQLVVVPLILLKMSFIIVVVVLTAIYFFLALYGIFNEKIRKKNWNAFVNNYRFFHMSEMDNTKKMINAAAIIVMFLAVSFVILASVLLQHTDDDDSRFVVNSTDIIRTNKMMLTNPSTGEYEGTWVGEVARDVVSPWAVYIAYIAKLTMVHPTIIAHLILPIILLIISCLVYWLISEVIFHENIFNRCVFVCLIILLNIYGFYSIYGQETFLLTRVWQGKAVVAGIGIPLFILEFLRIYNNESNKENYFFVIITEFAVCLMSGMGILLGAIMAGAYGLIYGIIKKSPKLTVGLWLCVIPNVIFYLLSRLI